MAPWIRFDADLAPVPGAADSLADALRERLSVLSALVAPDGGVKRLELLPALTTIVRGFGLTVFERDSFASNEVDLIDTRNRIGVSLQAGRARTNNGALLSVLAAAAAPDVDWLIILAPTRYKSGAAAVPVTEDLREMASEAGIRLAVMAVLVLAY